MNRIHSLVHCSSGRQVRLPRFCLVATVLFICLAVSAVASAGGTTHVTFASDTTWAVSNSAGASLGLAQNVCLNASAPANCPAGATLYGWEGVAWTADLTGIPEATWVWAPGITGASSPAFPAQYFFSKAFTLSGTPIAGTISVSADDLAEVFVNGTSVGTIGSLTDPEVSAAAQTSLTTFDISSFLVSGSNVIMVRAENGPFGCGSGPYSCNPAGVVFGGSLEFQPAVLEVSIDIKPGSFPNSINPRSNGVIPVALLTTGSFDASTADPATIRFGLTGQEAVPVHSALEDVDGDGDNDLILHFKTSASGIQCGTTSASLTGETFSELVIQGADSIQTTGCH